MEAVDVDSGVLDANIVVDSMKKSMEKKSTTMLTGSGGRKSTCGEENDSRVERFSKILFVHSQCKIMKVRGSRDLRSHCRCTSALGMKKVMVAAQ